MEGQTDTDPDEYEDVSHRKWGGTACTFPSVTSPKLSHRLSPEFIDVYTEGFVPEFIDVYTESGRVFSCGCRHKSGPVFSCARRRKSPAGSIDMRYEYDTRAGQCSAALAGRGKM